MMLLYIFYGPTDHAGLPERYQSSVQGIENFTFHLLGYNPCGAPSNIVTVLSICPHLCRREARKPYTRFGNTKWNQPIHIPFLQLISCIEENM